MSKVPGVAALEQLRQVFPPMCRIRFSAQALEPIRLPVYPGSAWRGLLGHSLRRTVCVTRQPTCEGCLLTGTCAYSVFFESPPPTAESATRYTAVPHPFVLDVDPRPERGLAAGDQMHVGMTLIGPAIDLLPYLIQSMDRAGARGLGRTGSRFALQTLAAERRLGSDDWEQVYDADQGKYQRVTGERPRPNGRPPGPIRIDLLTPLRIKRHGHFVGAAELAPTDLVRNLIARLASLAAFYANGSELASVDAAALAAGLNLTDADLQWSDWTRFSSRQRTRMQMGGLVGGITLDGPGLDTLWPALWLGQWTHLGKATSFGLGKYRLHPEDKEPNTVAAAHA